jgi:hypothetical protein
MNDYFLEIKKDELCCLKENLPLFEDNKYIYDLLVKRIDFLEYFIKINEMACKKYEKNLRLDV